MLDSLRYNYTWSVNDDETYNEKDSAAVINFKIRFGIFPVTPLPPYQ